MANANIAVITLNAKTQPLTMYTLFLKVVKQLGKTVQLLASLATTKRVIRLSSRYVLLTSQIITN